MANTNYFVKDLAQEVEVLHEEQVKRFEWHTYVRIDGNTYYIVVFGKDANNYTLKDSTFKAIRFSSLSKTVQLLLLRFTFSQEEEWYNGPF